MLFVTVCETLFMYSLRLARFEESQACETVLITSNVFVRFRIRCTHLSLSTLKAYLRPGRLIEGTVQMSTPESQRAKQVL